MNTKTNFRTWYLLWAVLLVAALSWMDTANFNHAKGMTEVVQAQTEVPPCPEDGNCPMGDDRTWGEYWENVRDWYRRFSQPTVSPDDGDGGGFVDDNERPFEQECDNNDADTSTEVSVGQNGGSFSHKRNERFMNTRCIRHCWSGSEACWATRCGNLGIKC